MNRRGLRKCLARAFALALSAGGYLSAACAGTIGGEENPPLENPRGPDSSLVPTGAKPGGDPDSPTIGPDGEPVPYPPSSTPLARLTNDEFFASAIQALSIADDAEGLSNARGTLAAEGLVGGLPNDVGGQLLTQVALSGYANLAGAVANAFLAGVDSQSALKERLECNVASSISDCSSEFGERVMARAYRRDVTSEDVSELRSVLTRFDEILAEKATDPASLESDLLRVATLIRAILLSPDFLLLVEKTAPGAGVQEISSDEVATRLSYLLVGQPPDEALRAVARAGQLGDADVRVSEATRLLATEAGKTRIRNTMMGWLGVNEEGVGATSVASLASFIDDWFTREKPLSSFYDAPIPVAHMDGSTSEEPLGVLGMDGFLGSHTSPPTPAFITRGVFLVERLLCSALPADVPAEAFESDEKLTDNQIFEVHDKAPCASCHVLFDNYGAALQQFDAETGLYEPGATELGTGFELYDLGGISGVVDGPKDLARTLAASERAPSCVAQLWYRNAMRRSLDPSRDEERVVSAVMDTWKNSGDTSLKSYLLTLVASEHFVSFVP